MKPEISVVTAAFNAADTIGTALKSAGASAERIVIDNCSTDRTLEIAKAAAPDAKIVSEPDSGIYDAMNKGLRLASGEITACLNADDFYLPGTLDKVRAFFAEHPETEILSGNIMVGERVVRPASGPASFHGARIFHPAAFIRKSLFEKIGYFDDSLKICADLDFFLRAKENHAVFRYLDEPLTQFALGGVSTRARHATAREVRQILLKHGFSPVFAWGNWCFAEVRAFLSIILKRGVCKTSFQVYIKKKPTK